MRTCIKCGSPLNPAAKGNLCIQHYLEKKTRDSDAKRQAVYDELDKGLSRKEVAAKLGFTLDFVKKAELYRPKPARPLLRDILAITSEIMFVTQDKILSSARTRHITSARMAFCYTAHQFGYPLTVIGRFIKRDHSTVSNAVDRISYAIGKDEQIAARVSRIVDLSGKAKPFINERTRPVVSVPVIRTQRTQEELDQQSDAIRVAGIRAGSAALLDALRAAQAERDAA